MSNIIPRCGPVGFFERNPPLFALLALALIYAARSFVDLRASCASKADGRHQEEESAVLFIVCARGYDLADFLLVVAALGYALRHR